MKEKFPNLVKDLDMQVQEADSQTRWIQRGPLQDESYSMPKVKYRERTLKNSKRNAVSYLGGVPIRLAADFSKGTLQARRDLQEIFKVMKSRDLQPR